MRTKYILGFLGTLLILGGGFFVLMYQQKATPKPIACSMEAKLCPDGSAVGRSGPRCEFSECPATAPLPQVPAPLPYGTVTLHVNETATFSGLVLTLLRVSDDSRCGEGVTCIWAGTLHAELRVSSGLGISTPTIELGKFVTTEAEIISLLSASPYPKSGMTISSEDYALTFSVLKRDGMTPQ